MPAAPPGRSTRRAGSAGASPHLEATLDIIRAIAREEGLHFRLAIIRADISNEVVKKALRQDRLRPLGKIPDITEADIDACIHIVGQIGTEAFVRALKTGADVIIAGRSCDTAVFAAIPQLLDYPMGLVMHMAKIIECTSICCTPGGRDAILGLLDDDGFVFDSMNRARHATPTVVPPREIFILVESIARTAEQAGTAVGVFKQYLLHHGFPGRLSTGGNIAFPFTPPELEAGTAYRFQIYHVMDTEDLASLFPIAVELL